MRRYFVFLLIPFLLFALEKVNLIKDAGFEKGNGVWNSYVGRGPTTGLKPVAKVSTYDSGKAYTGTYSAHCDTRESPVDLKTIDGDTAIIIQGFSTIKHVTDMDSLLIHYSVFPLDNDLSKTYVVRMGLYLDANGSTSWVAVYYLKAPSLDIFPSPPQKPMDISDFPADTMWHLLAKNVFKDLTQLGFTAATTVDSLVLCCGSINYPPWRGQKIYFDDIRLTGYADYDVGIKELLSGDSVWKNTDYTPTARIKNFGRKPADSFLVIAEIEGGSGTVYADTLSWSLTADTEDTVSFKEFKPSDASNYTLTVSTIMTPDESDEDDAVSRTLFGTAVAEPVLSPQSLSLQIEGVLRAGLSSIRYSLPLGEQGTISLYDPSGRRVESLTVTGSGSINLKSNLPSGVYFVKLDSGKTSVTRKAVILR